jgi:3',5'-nucleoside bisphosphate phosphatase
MKIDFHVHTAERSSCASALTTEQIRKAISAGLNGIAITDHHRLVHPFELAKYNQIYAPFIIYPGIEITSGGEDWLVLGLSDTHLESEDWSYPDLHQFVRAHGGYIVLAHPYRYKQYLSVDVFSNPPDAIEIRSINIRSENVPRIQELAGKLNVPTLCNSDAHTTSALGHYYNILSPDHSARNGIFDVLKTGAVKHSVD